MAKFCGVVIDGVSGYGGSMSKARLKDATDLYDKVYNDGKSLIQAPDPFKNFLKELQDTLEKKKELLEKKKELLNEQ